MKENFKVTEADSLLLWNDFVFVEFDKICLEVCFYFINWFMKTELYKFQTRQQKIEREDSATRPQELSKVSSYTPGHWKSYIPHEISLSSEKRSQRVPSYYNYRNGEPNYDTAEEDSRVRSILSVRKEEERKRQ